MVAISWLMLIIIFGVCLLRWLPKIKLSSTKKTGIKRLPGKWGLKELILFVFAHKENKFKTFLKLIEFERPFRAPMWGIVVFNDYDTIKHVSADEDWQARPFNPVILERSFGNEHLGILENSGEDWKHSRNFTFKTLKHFGLGIQNIMQVRVDDELVIQLDSIKKTFAGGNDKSAKICVKDMFNISVVKVLWNIAAGSQPVEDAGEFGEIMKLSDDISKAYYRLYVVTQFPILGYIIPPRISGLATFRKDSQRMKEYCMDLLQKRRSEGRYLSAKDDFIEAYLWEIDQELSSTGCNIKFTDESLTMILFDLFEIGSTTTGGNIEYAIQHMIQNPHVQKKVQEEIHRILGHERFPTGEDRLNMPYTQATLLECSRVTPTVMINVRAAIRDTYVDECFVKKDTIGLLDYNAINMSEKLWVDPKVFRPERFLDAGNTLINTEKLFIYGGGRRYCVGAPLAKSMVFTFLVGILKRYTVSQVPGENDVYKDPYIGLTTQPASFNAIFTKITNE